MSPDEIIRIGRGSERLLEDECVQLAFDEMRDALLHRVETIPTDDVDNSMAVLRQLRALRMLKVKLEGYVQQAKYKQMELDK